MALKILGIEVLLILISTKSDNSVAPQVIQPSEFFPSAITVPMVYISSYLRAVFNPHSPGADVIASTQTSKPKLLAWLNPLLATPLSPLTPLADVFQSLSPVLCSDPLTDQQLSALRDVLSRDVSVNDLELLLNVTAGTELNLVYDAYDIAKYFYANSAQSSAGGLASVDKVRLLVDLILIANGTDHCPSFQAASDVARIMFRNILPVRWDDESKDEVVAGMMFLATSNLTSQDIAVIVDHFVKDSFLRTGSPSELIRFISTFLATDSRRPLCNNLHRYGVLRCSNVTMKDLGRLCVELVHYESASQYYGVKVLSRLIATSLDCNNQTLPTTPSPTTAKPLPACGISDVRPAGRRFRSVDPKIRPLIIGGVSAGSCAVYPWMVRLFIDDTEVCGGAVLDARHILTAAHCVTNKNSIKATVGEYDINVHNDLKQFGWVDMNNGIFIHPNFSYSGRRNDIAVIKLNTSIDLYQPCAKPLCLDPTFHVQYGQKCQVAGWGLTKVGDVYGSDILQTISISTYIGTDCVTLFPNAVLTDPTKQLCAGELDGKIDSCTGDSGGPLFCYDNGRWVAAGVVSYGNINCATVGYPGVYGDLSHYYDWIQQQLTK